MPDYSVDMINYVVDQKPNEFVNSFNAQMQQKVTDIIMNRDYKSVRNAYDSVCGAYSTSKEKRWIIDLDGVDQVSPLMCAFIEYRCEPITELTPDCSLENSKCIAVIPTKNGIHLITKPFNLEKFRKEYPEVDVHKNNPTVLYV